MPFGAVMKDRTSESVKNRKAIDQCKDSYDELKDSMEEHAKERKESLKSAKTEAATYQNLADKSSTIWRIKQIKQPQIKHR